MDVPGGSVTAVAALVADHPDWLSSNSLSPNDIAVTALGTGESYAAWLATAVESPTSVVVVRVARRPGPELPASPREEFAGLSLAPAGVGPTPRALAALGPFPVIVESLVPGQIRTGRYWADPSLLAAHARTLARLHRRRWLAAGPVTAADTNVGGVSFVAEVESAIAHWAPRIDGSPFGGSFARLGEALRSYAARVEPEFAPLRSFALIHGDSIMTNILVTGPEDASRRRGCAVTGIGPIDEVFAEPQSPADARPLPGLVTRLVDWEWTRIGDPARDLGLIGGAVHADPWYADLNEDLLDGFVSAYRGESEVLGSDVDALGDARAMRVRRDAWLVAEGFAVLAYLHWRDASLHWRDGGPRAVDQRVSTRRSPGTRHTAAALEATLTACLRPQR